MASKKVESLIPLLQKQEVFAELSDDEIKEFASSAKFKSFEPGTRIIEQGAEGNEFYVIMDGQVRAVDTSQDPPNLLNYHFAGDMIGTRALLNDDKRAAAVEGVLDGELAIFNREAWEWLVHNQPRIVDFFKSLELEFEKRAVTDFPGQHWDEVVVASTKRHWLVFLSRLTIPLALMIVPIAILILAQVFSLDQLTPDSWTIVGCLTLPFIILAGALTFYHYEDWRNDDFIVTTKRFIHIERRLFYGEERKEAPLTRIEDITLSYPSFLNRFDYHNLLIKTAGVGDILVDGVTNAPRMKDRIFDEKKRAEARVQASDVAAARTLLAKQLDWEGAIEKPVLNIAEPEGGIRSQSQTKPLPTYLKYLVPRLKEVESDGTTIIWRKHYWVLLQLVGVPIIAILFSLYLFISALFGFAPFPDANIFLQIFLFLVVLGCIAWYVWEYDGWHRDTYILTDSRVIDVESSPFGMKGETRSEGAFEQIQNITYDIPDFFTHMLNMGTVVIETAGSKDTFTFEDVFNPTGVQQEIFSRMAVVHQRDREKERDAATANTIRVFSTYQHMLEKAAQRGIIKLTPDDSSQKTALDKA